MKNSLKLSLVAAALVALPLAAAHADQTPGWYVGGGVGATFTPESHARIISGPETYDFNTGWNVQGSAGYSWNNGLRAEGELFHSRAGVNSVEGGTGKSGALDNTDLFGNVLYDFHTGTMLTPYIGAGLGAAYVDGSDAGIMRDGSSFDGHDVNLAYQGIVGIASQLDENWALTADYRYIGTVNPKLHTTSGRGAYLDGNESHNIMVGVRYSFGEPAAVPVKTAAPVVATTYPAPAPVVAAVPQSYMVFFDFNKATLTPEAQRIIASAAQDFKKGSYVRIVVTGHTDTVGNAAYNKKLSDRRAAAIKAELAKLGVSSSLIKTVGVGKEGLLVPTQDGVREAQNRRGEIVFNK